jgi:hypothetical protein
MQKINLIDSHRTIKELQDSNLVNIYYNDETGDYFIICDSEPIKMACESMGVLSMIVGSLCALKNKLTNVFVLCGVIYSSEQMQKLSIASYKKNVS